jgi:pyrroline-5-carboxylate reductase
MADRIAIIGAGKMGEALMSGLLRAGRSAADLTVTTRRPERAKDISERYGVDVVDNATAVKSADTVVIAVKPQDMATLLDEISAAVSKTQLVVSVAAGITTSFIERRLGDDVAVVRVMSNTPVLVDEAMSVISAGSHAGEEHLVRAEALLRREHAARSGIPAGCGYRAFRQRARVLLLLGRGDDGRRDPAWPAEIGCSRSHRANRDRVSSNAS